MNKLRAIQYVFLFLPLFSNALMGTDVSIKKENFSPSNLPSFESYSTSEAYKGKIAPVDINSYPEARKYRTRLREGVKSGPNFAGHYVVIPIGCGTNCQNQWVVNVKTGQVLARYLTTLGAEYRIDSNLLILNAPIEEYRQIYKENPKTAYLTGKTVYLVWKKDKPSIIYQEEVTNLLRVH